MKMWIMGPLTESRLDVGQGDDMYAIMYYTALHCPPEDLCSGIKMSNSFLLCNRTHVTMMENPGRKGHQLKDGKRSPD